MPLGRHVTALSRLFAPDTRTKTRMIYVMLRNAFAASLVLPSVVATHQLTEQPARVGANRQAARISGVVYDSLTNTPLAGAVVQLVALRDSLAGPRFSAISDSLGAYSVEDVPPGRYAVAFFHVALDTLGIAVAARQTEIGNEALLLDLATPSAATLIESLCTASADTASRGLLIGHIRSAASDGFLEGATATVTWSAWISEDREVRQEIRKAVATARENGWFGICNVPTDGVLHIRAGFGADSSGPVEVFVPSGGLRHVSLYVAGAARDAQLVGLARDSSGRPLPNALATMLEIGREARANSRGAFLFDSLPSGTHMLEVASLGYKPERIIVQLAPGRRTSAEVTLNRYAVELEAVRIIAKYEGRLAEFERHRARAIGGHFITEEELRRRPGATIGPLVQGLPGLIVRFRPEGYQVRMRRAATNVLSGIEECSPTVYIDGSRSGLGMEYVEWMFRSGELAGIEVYVRPTERPMEFVDPFNKCGAIAIWTKPSAGTHRPRR